MKEENGKVVRLKAQYCVDGSSEEVTEEETPALTAKHSNLRVITGRLGRKCKTTDVPNAYLKTPIPEGVNIYMKQPKGREGKAKMGLQIGKVIVWSETCSATMEQAS